MQTRKRKAAVLAQAQDVTSKQTEKKKTAMKKGRKETVDLEDFTRGFYQRRLFKMHERVSEARNEYRTLKRVQKVLEDAEDFDEEGTIMHTIGKHLKSQAGKYPKDLVNVAPARILRFAIAAELREYEDTFDPYALEHHCEIDKYMALYLLKQPFEPETPDLEDYCIELAVQLSKPGVELGSRLESAQYLVAELFKRESVINVLAEIRSLLKPY